MLMGYVCMGGAGDTSLDKLVSRYLCAEVTDTASEAHYISALYGVFVAELEKTGQMKLY